MNFSTIALSKGYFFAPNIAKIEVENPTEFINCMHERGIKIGLQLDRAEGVGTQEPNYEKFPTLKLAYQAGIEGGSATVCLNAANEEAVFAFLEKKISLWEIYEITNKLMQSHENIISPTLDEIFEIDRITRETVKKLTKI